MSVNLVPLGLVDPCAKEGPFLGVVPQAPLVLGVPSFLVWVALLWEVHAFLVALLVQDHAGL